MNWLAHYIWQLKRTHPIYGGATTKPAESAANIGRHSPAIKKHVYQDGSDG
jgi:hypothetical protein